MRDRSKIIVTIFTVIIVTVIVLVCGGQRALVTASSTPINVPGPSQFYLQHNLISDGFVPADLTHSNLVNAWGLVSGPTTPWWIANNGTGTTTLYNVATGTIVADFTVPGAGGAQGNPTGLVFNGGTGFVVNNGVGSPAAARFIFASEDGTISAFKGAPIVTVVPNAQAPQRMMRFIRDSRLTVPLRANSFMQPISTTVKSTFLIVHSTPSRFPDLLRIRVSQQDLRHSEFRTSVGRSM